MQVFCCHNFGKSSRPYRRAGIRIGIAVADDPIRHPHQAFADDDCCQQYHQTICRLPEIGG